MEIISRFLWINIKTAITFCFFTLLAVLYANVVVPDFPAVLVIAFAWKVFLPLLLTSLVLQILMLCFWKEIGNLGKAWKAGVFSKVEKGALMVDGLLVFTAIFMTLSVLCGYYIFVPIVDAFSVGQ